MFCVIFDFISSIVGFNVCLSTSQKTGVAFLYTIAFATPTKLIEGKIISSPS